jgi:hypothetical protein
MDANHLRLFWLDAGDFWLGLIPSGSPRALTTVPRA